MSLIARYQFEGNVNDTGGAYNGTATSVTYGTGREGAQAGVFTGSASYVALPDNAALRPLQITVAAWAKPAGITSGNKTFVGNLNPSSFNAGWVLRQEGAAVAGYVYVSGAYRQVIQASALTAGTWVHTVLTYDGATVRLYLNGVAAGTPLAAAGSITYSTPHAPGIGGYGGSFDMFTGSIDDARIYNNALTAQDVLDLYNSYNGSLMLRRRRAAVA